MVLKDSKGSLIGENDAFMKSGWECWVSASFSPINEPLLSFNTNQKLHSRIPKTGDLLYKNCMECSPDPFSFRPNLKKKQSGYTRLEFEITIAKLLVLCLVGKSGLVAYKSDIPFNVVLNNNPPGSISKHFVYSFTEGRNSYSHICMVVSRSQTHPSKALSLVE